MSSFCEVCQLHFAQNFNYKRHLISTIHHVNSQKRTDDNISDSLEKYDDTAETVSQYGGGGAGNSDVAHVGMFHPFTAILSDPTQCGKTNFIFRFIENVEELMLPQPERIVYCYGKYQFIFAEYSQVEFREGLPKFSDCDGRR